ncbi:MAG: hypothetical protein H0W07_10620 [Chloroflexi bacterium]|nr:hypothetical protein [Chloroflexota bacterium]
MILPRPRPVRLLLVVGLVATMSGLATGAAANSEPPAVHDHGAHLHAPPAAAVEPLAEAQGSGPECTATGDDFKKPDLRMARIKDLVIAEPYGDPGEPAPIPPGAQYLRFTTIVMNIGAGPFAVKGTKDLNDAARMTTKQKLFRTAQPGTGPANCQLADSPAVARWGGDGHSHWHIQRMQRFDLYGFDGTGNIVDLDRPGYKVGFCFFDGLRMRPTLPGYSSEPRFSYGGCGNSTSDDRIRMGLSVGWGDIYPYTIAHQWIDVTGLANGEYRVCATVDPLGHYVESDATNNQTYSDIAITGMGSANPAVTETAHAWAACDS